MKDTTPFSRKGHVVERLLELCQRLRGDGGCAWDREQTLATLTPYLLEEVHEVIEAVALGDATAIREEVGDLLFVTIFALHATETEGVGELEEIVDGTYEKLVRRHPHVFGDAPSDDPQHARQQWQRAKRAESDDERPSVLGDAPGSRPPLLTAFRLQEKAAAVGFDWISADGALDKVREEVDEVAGAASANGSGDDATAHAHVRAELGDLLFATVNACRKLSVDPEQALHVANRTFYGRFRGVEALLAAEDRAPEDATLEELEALWQKVKRAQAPDP